MAEQSRTDKGRFHQVLSTAKRTLLRTKPNPESTNSSSEPNYQLAGSFPYGIDVWVPCADADVDICFIHGLTGSRDSTWTAEGETEPWPKRFLPNALRELKARILAYGYDAYPVHWGTASSKRLTEHAESFLSALTANRARNKASARPLIIVAHSLGGLVCKETIILSRDSPEAHLNALFNMTKGIVFMGTPHTGSPVANWAHLPASIFGMVKSTNAELLRVLKMDDEMLDSVNMMFGFMLRRMREDTQGSVKKIESTCFFETRPYLLIGLIVPKTSATFPFDPAHSIDANHSNMVKFASPEDPGFVLVSEELRRWSAEVVASKPSYINLESHVDIALRLLGIPISTNARVAIADCIKPLNMGYDLNLLQENAHKTDPKIIKEREEIERKVADTYDKAAKDLLISLWFESMTDREASIESAADTMCQWIYQNPTYLHWDSNDSRLLWIKGKPGSGKSVLMKSLYDKRRHDLRASSTIILGFFFNARGSPTERSKEALYRTMLHNLAQSSPILMCELLSIYLKKRTGRGRVDWKTPELTALFHARIEKFQSENIEVFIDALDECSDTEVREVVDSFEKSLNVTRQGTVLRICWSSRFYPHIGLKTTQGVELELNKMNTQDIRKYTQHAISVELQRYWVHVVSDIVSLAEGIFLWAILVAKKIEKAFSAGTELKILQTMLSNTPKNDLDKLFLEIFDDPDFTTEQKDDLLPIADIVLGSQRPLSLDELYTALLLNANDKSFQDIRDVDMAQLEKRIINVSGGLIEVVKVSRDLEQDDEDISVDWMGVLNRGEIGRYRGRNKRQKIVTTRVQVIHESVRDFFLKQDGLSILRSRSYVEFEIRSQSTLTRACFNGLIQVTTHLAEFKYGRSEESPSAWDQTPQLLVPPTAWKPPNNKFLMNYLQYYALLHFKRLLWSLKDTDTLWTVIRAADTPKKIIYGYLSLCCFTILHSGELSDMCKEQLMIILRCTPQFDSDIVNFKTVLEFPNRFTAIVQAEQERREREEERIDVEGWRSRPTNMDWVKAREQDRSGKRMGRAQSGVELTL